MNNCSDKGDCHLKKCYCFPGYYSEDCSLSNISYFIIFLMFILANCTQESCNSNGFCVNSKCFCYAGYEGTFCEKGYKTDNFFLLI